jgi:NAD(P)-dependent dehydrogenase (short-subunit alcohol dehydrogenase family)
VDLMDYSDDAIIGPVAQRFQGKAGIVVGGGRTPAGHVAGINIGGAHARLLAKEGCKVAVLDIDPEAADRTVTTIKDAGGDAFAVQADITKERDCERAVEATVDRYGRLDVLMNTCGIALSRRGVTDVSAEEWDRLMNVNVKGFMFTAKYSIPAMTEGGAIINIGSYDAVRPSYGSAGYAASKGAVASLTLHLAAREGYRGIRANCVHPVSPWTPIATRSQIGAKMGSPVRELQAEEMTPAREKRRLNTALEIEGSAWDIAHASVFLASDQARWITGQILLVDGGASVLASQDVAQKPHRTLPDYSIIKSW